MAHLRMPMNGQLFAGCSRRWTVMATAAVPKPSVLHTSTLFKCSPSMCFTRRSAGQLPSHAQLFHSSTAIRLPRSFRDSKESSSEARSFPDDHRDDDATSRWRTRARSDAATLNRSRNSRPFRTDGQNEEIFDRILFGPASHLNPQSLAKIFALLGGVFIASAWWSDIRARMIEKNVSKRAFESADALSSVFSPFMRWFNTLGLADERAEIKELRNAWAQTKAARAGEIYRSLMDSLSSGPEVIQNAVSTSYLSFIEWNANLPAYKQAVLPILFINASIFLAWKHGPLQPFLKRYFLDFALPTLRGSQSRSRIFPMIGANFSHMSFLHFLFNNMALWSFGAIAFDKLVIRPGAADKDDADQNRRRLASVNDPWHEVDLTAEVIGFCICAGVVASFLSRTNRLLHYRRLAGELRTLQKSTRDPSAPGKLNALRETLYHHRQRYSLGFSGALYAMIVTTAFNCPNVRIGILFIPGTDIGIQDGVFAMVMFDLVCLICFPNSFLDHAAHLGGAVFAMWWHSMGQRSWVAVRDWFHQMGDGAIEHEGRGRRLQ